MGSDTGLVRLRLRVLFFLEFFVWGAWMVPIGGYGPKVLGLTGAEMGWIFSATAIGAIVSPMFVGYVADRLFSTERVLAALHLIGGVCLCLAAEQTTFWPVFILLMINALCFMPTLALVNSLTFRNIDDPDSFPRFAVLGTIGWIVSGLMVGIALGGENAKWFFYVAGGTGILLAVYCPTLPHTPPKGRDEAGGDVLGFGSLSLLKEPSFLLFVICAFLITIPATYYFVICNPFLGQTDRPAPTALMTLCQFSEILVMFTMPLFIPRLGLRRVLALGMLAWSIRYFCFASLSFPLVILGLLVHGFCYCFMFVGAYIYIDKKAPRDLRASAQSFISFVMWGLGWFVGAQLAGYTYDQYPASVTTMAAVEQTDDGTAEAPEAALPKWDNPAAAESAWRYLDVAGTIEKLREEESATGEQETILDIGKVVDADEDGHVTRCELDAISDDGLKSKELTYSKTELIEVFEKIDGGKEIRTKADVASAVSGQISVTRADWLQAQSQQWPSIWLWPAGMAAAACALFWFGSRDEEETEAEAEKKSDEE